MASVHQNEEFAKSILLQNPLDEACEFIHRNLEPDDVFSESQLAAWAEQNGFTKE